MSSLPMMIHVIITYLFIGYFKITRGYRTIYYCLFIYYSLEAVTIKMCNCHFSVFVNKC